MKLKVKNNKKKLKAPKLRFPEFTDDWEEFTLGKLGKLQSGIGFPDAEQGGKEGIPFYKVSDMNNFGNEHEMTNSNNYVNLEQIQRKKWKPIETVPAVIFAKVGAAIMLNRKRLVRSSFLIDNNTMSYIFDDSWDTDFGKVLFETINLPRYSKVGALPSYNASDIENICVMVPNKNEQIKIGKFFKEIDQLITLNHNKISHIKDLKAGLLQKMFPKNWETKPEIRFDGFTSDWKECLMENLVTQVVREVSKPKEPYKRVSVRSHAKGTFQQKVEDASKISMSKLFIVKKNDLIVNITFAWEHAIAVATDKDDGLLVSHRFPTYRSEGKSDINFIHYLVSKEEFRKKMDLISPGGAGRNRVLNKKEFLKISSFVPELSEQQKIGEFFSQLDKLLTLYQRKLEHLQEQKKSLLKQMFI